MSAYLIGATAIVCGIGSPVSGATGDQTAAPRPVEIADANAVTGNSPFMTGIGSSDIPEVIRPVQPAEKSKPVAMGLSYTGDLWSVRKGGVSRGQRYLHRASASVDMNFGSTFGLSGTNAHFDVNYTGGKSVTGLIGDAQSASSIESGVQSVRLNEAWVDHRLGFSKSLRIGIYDLNSEFDALASSALFVGGPYGMGTDIGQSGGNGPSVFPNTGLAARLAWKAENGLTVRAAILDGVPGNLASPKRFSLSLKKRDGALLIGEIEAPLKSGKLLAGFWRYTNHFDTNSGGRRKGNQGVYIRGEARLFRELHDEDQGMTGFFRLGMAAAKFNQFSRFISAGLIYTGAVPGRDLDQLGIGFARGQSSASYRASTGGKKAETNVELTYNASLGDLATIQPFVQRIMNPGTDQSTHDATAIGIRLGFDIGL